MKNYDTKETYKIKNNNKIADSFDNAINGIVESVNTERNMLFHVIMAILVLGVSLFMDFTRVELIIVGLTISLVIATELINTSIEVLTDLVTEGKYNELAKKVKDISAGAVLVTAVLSVFVGYLIIYPKLINIFSRGMIFTKIMKNKEHLAIISLILVILFTVILKGVFYKKDTTHLFGGSVSGHTSIAFNLATIGSILSNSFIISLVFFALAILVAESRVEAKIHSVKEVVLGALIGIIIAFLLFFNF